MKMVFIVLKLERIFYFCQLALLFQMKRDLIVTYSNNLTYLKINPKVRTVPDTLRSFTSFAGLGS